MPHPFIKQQGFLTKARIDALIKGFFGANGAVSIVILGLITVFLFKEGLGFFPSNLHSLQLYRKSGLEFVDLMKAPVEKHTALSRSLQAIRLKMTQQLKKAGKTAPEIQSALAPLDAWIDGFDSSINDLRGMTSELGETVSAINQKARINKNLEEQRANLLSGGKADEAARVQIEELDFKAAAAPVIAKSGEYIAQSAALRQKVALLLEQPPALPSESNEAKAWKSFDQNARAYLSGYDQTAEELKRWNQFEPVPWYRGVTSFVTGKQWITNSFWHDWYGVLPLVTGSVLVAIVAMLVAVPFGVCAAIYVNQIASQREKSAIKPCIEFIAAIPSVVLGFFGIAVLGTTLRWLTQQEWLQWIPFFPISERLNALTAGLLLALMAIPTIFSLSEDALENVPRAFIEASEALGATRLQTIMRIMVPAALSGIVSAVLLGFGRVIGETMVVLLCAGNRIAIPDFTQGLGAFFQPVHTMTGIVAQEMGEVAQGSIHYRALFSVGIVLFLLSLLINYLAQFVVRRFKISA